MTTHVATVSLPYFLWRYLLNGSTRGLSAHDRRRVDALLATRGLCRADCVDMDVDDEDVALDGDDPQLVYANFIFVKGTEVA